MEPFISLKNINKSFGSVRALYDVELDIYPGEIHTILGENGAGKSTLINVLSGIYTPDSGTIFVQGKNVELSSPKDAISRGIGTVYQHFKLIECLTVKENIMIGQSRNNVDFDNRINSILSRYDISLNLNTYIEDMSVGERQMVEIVKVLYRGAKVLILDEPTTVFTPQESKKLFNIMDKMKHDGCAVVFISHKMDEVMEVSDKITVLRKGTYIKTLNKIETNIYELTELMVGSKIDLTIKKNKPSFGKTLIKIDNISASENGKKIFKNINFEVREGEVLGIAGIAGAGQKELCEAIAGVRKVKKGHITFEGENIEGKNPREFIKRGINLGFVPEDRLGMGLIGSMDMVDNLMLKSYYCNDTMFLNRKPFKKKALDLVDQLDIKTPGVNYPIKYLSGGNIQKILLGREICIKPRLLILVYPVRGLDINTCFTIYNIINEEKAKGTAVVFVGEDLDILLELCDKIMVMSGGENTGIVDSSETTKEKLGLMMLGIKNGVKKDEIH